MATLIMPSASRVVAAPRAIAALLLALLLAWVTPALAHTTLLSATPAKNGIIPRGAAPVRLVFSEPIEAPLATISIISADGHEIKLRPRADPKDVHAVLADFDAAAAGTFRLKWRVVSADGHAISGSYVFHIETRSDAVPPTQGVTQDPAAPAGTTTDSPGVAPRPGVAPDTLRARQGTTGIVADTSILEGAAVSDSPPVIPSVLRASAAFALLGSAGLLIFLGWLVPPSAHPRAARIALLMSLAAIVLCALHALTWAAYATNDGDMSAVRVALTSRAGRFELARAIFAGLAAWSLVLVRRARWAAVFASLGVLATAAIGHAASISPALLIPLKAVHLAAASLWLGGLLVLFAGDAPNDRDTSAFKTAAMRVSSIALTAVILIAITGVIQTLLVMDVSQVLSSRYGILSLAKVGTLVVLIVIGALNKFRHLPAVMRGEAVRALRRNVTLEVAAIAVAFVLAGALAYTSPPDDPARATQLRSEP